jgi:hypothetical protein
VARDGFVRAALKRVARFSWETDLALHRWWRRRGGDKPFDLGGRCELCAQCCEAPALAVPWPVRRLRSVRALFLAWQKHVNRFHFVREEPKHSIFVFRCDHFDRRTRRCDSYDTRPGACRDYPRNLMWQTAPEMLPGCGYRPLAPGAGSMLRELERRRLTPEQMAKLKKGLFLE